MKRLIWTALTLSICGQSPATAADVAMNPCKSANQYRPVPKGMIFYPERARRMGKKGKAIISCTLLASGKVEACEIVSEKPTAYGFGESAIRIAETLFVFDTTQAACKAVVGQKIEMPVSYGLE